MPNVNARQASCGDCIGDIPDAPGCGSSIPCLSSAVAQLGGDIGDDAFHTLQIDLDSMEVLIPLRTTNADATE